MSHATFPLVKLTKGVNRDHIDADAGVEFWLNEHTTITVTLSERPSTGEWKVKVINIKNGGISVEPSAENSLLISGTR